MGAGVAIVGGGIAGLTLAQELLDRGVRDIVIVEAEFCGAGATGRSSGFITPPSELELSRLVQRFGEDSARRLWDRAQESCDHIRAHADEVLDADSLFVASDARSFGTIRDEFNARRALGYEATIYPDVSGIVGSTSFGGGVRFGRTFAINAYDYVTRLSDRLDITIFESSRAVSVRPGEVRTAHGCVQAAQVAVCIDHQSKHRGAFRVQTFLAVTEPLTNKTLHSIFPDGPLLVWDTDLVYQYFRPTPDRRLLVGGGLLTRTYLPPGSGASGAVEHLIDYARRRFPQLAKTKFAAWWPGAIGVTKDFLPLAGQIDDHCYIAGCAAGLPWSVVAARVTADLMTGRENPDSHFFQPDRSFTDLDLLQPLIGKPLTFAASHYYAKHFLRGDAKQVKRRKNVIVVLAALLAALFLWRRKRRR